MLEAIKQIGFTLLDFFNGIYDFLVNLSSYIVSIFGFLFYAGKTLIIGVFKLFVNILDGGVFVNVSRSFHDLSSYIGGPATIFICALFFVVIVRILIAFVFKLLRLNIDYHSLNSKSKRWNQQDSFQKYSDKSLFG